MGQNRSRAVRQTLAKLGLAFFAAGILVFGGTAVAKEMIADEAVVTLTALPVQAQQTAALIRSGGPFRSAKDGVVFGNRERQLPRKPRGFYREYTVPTPGARDRGARRIVCGGREVTQPEACYYTADHYASFRRIVQ